jgi:hypothetical protein
MAISKEELYNFLVRLQRLTESKRVKWTDTPDDNIFRTVMKEGAVLVERLRPAPDVFAHRIVVLNGNNQPIADFQSHDSQQEATLRSLFNAARDSALKSEDVFRNLIGELESLGK